MAEQKILHVGNPTTTQGFLGRIFGEGPLQGNKHQRQHQQGEDEIIQPGIQAAAIHRRHIQPPGANQCGHARQHHADDAVTLFLMAKHAEETAGEADTNADKQGNT